MSHVVTLTVSIRDLTALKTACTKLGLEFKEGQETYKWFGKHVGDYPLPKGFTKEDMGKCLHAISVKGNKNAYEIGVVKRRDGEPGYTLMFDFWAGGGGLMAAVGQGCGKLVQGYTKEVTIQEAKDMGFFVEEKQLDDGTVELYLTEG
jgi:hypothetical protein